MPGPEAAGDVLDTAEAGRRVLVGGAVRLVGYGVGLVASIIAAAVVIRYLGTVDLGRFNTVIALVTGLQIVTDLGITSLGVREYSQRRGADRERFMRVLLGMRLVTTALLLAVATAAAVVLGYDRDMIVGTLLLAVAASISAVNSTVGIPLAADIRMGVITAIDVARQVGIGLGYVLLTLTGAGIVAFLGISIPIYLLVLLATFAFVRGSVPLRPIFQPRAWNDLMRPTLGFALAAAAGSIYVYGAMVLTELVVSDVETGLFAAAFRVYIVVAGFPVLLVMTALPVLSRAARDDHARLVVREPAPHRGHGSARRRNADHARAWRRADNERARVRRVRRRRPSPAHPGHRARADVRDRDPGLHADRAAPAPSDRRGQLRRAVHQCNHCTHARCHPRR